MAIVDVGYEPPPDVAPLQRASPHRVGWSQARSKACRYGTKPPNLQDANYSARNSNALLGWSVKMASTPNSNMRRIRRSEFTTQGRTANPAA